MSISVKEARTILRKLGVKGYRSGDGRTYFAVPYTDSCGETIPWVMVIYSKRRKVESLGAHCKSCDRVVAIPLNKLRSLATTPILDEIEGMAKRLDKELKSNVSWFKELIATRLR